MRLYLFFLLLFFVLPLEATDYYLKKGQKLVQIPFGYSGKILVNDLCLRDLKNCQALQKYHSPLKKNVKVIGENPARLYCHQVGGVSFTLFNRELTKGNAFCAFGDKSLIGSWQLYQSYLGERK